MGEGYTGREVADAVGITYRQLDYWARTDLIRPSLQDARGYGSRRRYSMDDVLLIRLVKALLDAGIRLEVVRDDLPIVQEHQRADLADAFVVVADRRAHFAPTADALLDLIKEIDGVATVIGLHTLLIPIHVERQEPAAR